MNEVLAHKITSLQRCVSRAREELAGGTPWRRGFP
jgi:hypothetical protein